MRAKQPNILLIMADQMAAAALPCYGHEVVNTPALATLAESGVVFQNAYCNSPLCAPSRFSMMSGQLPSRIGAYDNAANFPADVPTIAHYLRARGYFTCLAGKMHFVGPDQLHGFEERLTTDIYPSDYGWTPDWERFERRPSWYHDMLSVVQAGVCEASNQLDFDEEVSYQATRRISQLARRPDGRPFFLLISFTHPHDPFAITEEYWNRYVESEIDEPSVSPIPYDQLDPHSRRLYHVCAMDQYDQTAERVRRARHAYYGMISYVDDKVGLVIETLEKFGLRDDTVVIFLSDHGEMLGERGFWYKMSFFEWSARVPLIVNAPGRFAPRRVARPVSLVDLLPTLEDLTGGNAKDSLATQVDGRSLLPLIEGRAAGERSVVLGEMLGEGAVAPLLMIRDGRYKYIFSPPDPEQLYDLQTDPHELTNLAGQPAVEETLQAFREQASARWDADGLREQVLDSQRRRRLVDRALRQGRHTPWDFQPVEDTSQQYMRSHLDLNVLERSARFPSPEMPEPDGR